MGYARSFALSHIHHVTVRSLALPHILHATLVCVLLRFQTCVMLHYCAFSCTSAHAQCYAIVCSLALSHIRPACVFPDTFKHAPCYTTVWSLALSHMRHGTLLWVLLHFHICHDSRHACVFSCTFTCVMLRHCGEKPSQATPSTNVAKVVVS